MPAADLTPFRRQHVPQHPAARERMLEVQLVEAAHQHEIGVRGRARQIVDAAPADPERLRLPGERQSMGPVDHRLALAGQRFFSGRARQGRTAGDITYVPMARGFVYLVAIVDWFSRKVLAWRLSITLSADFCVEALQEALDRHGKPEFFNTDQGSQFTSTDVTKVLKTAEIAISMDGKGAWRDNVFVERLWRTVKYEEVYLRAYAGVAASPRLDRPVPELLQRQEAAFVAWRENPRPGIHQPGGANPGGSLKWAAEPLRNTPREVFRQTEPPLVRASTGARRNGPGSPRPRDNRRSPLCEDSHRESREINSIMLDEIGFVPEDPEELRAFMARLLAEVKAQAILIEKLRHQLAGHRAHRFVAPAEAARPSRRRRLEAQRRLRGQSCRSPNVCLPCGSGRKGVLRRGQNTTFQSGSIAPTAMELSGVGHRGSGRSASKGSSIARAVASSPSARQKTPISICSGTVR